MKQGNIYTSSFPSNPPAWYWARGLHDACIIGVEALEFPFDYNRFIKEKENYCRNLFTLKLDAKGALFDTSIKEILLYNYKILSEDVSLENRKQIWWKADRLTDYARYYILEIDLADFDADPEEFTFKIKFDRAEVYRKK